MDEALAVWARHYAQTLPLHPTPDEYVITKGRPYVIAWATQHGLLNIAADVFGWNNGEPTTIPSAIERRKDLLVAECKFMYLRRTDQPLFVVVRQPSRTTTYLLSPEATPLEDQLHPVSAAIKRRGRFTALGFTEEEANAIEQTGADVRAVAVALRLHENARTPEGARRMVAGFNSLSQTVQSALLTGVAKGRHETTLEQADLLLASPDLLKL